ncbi:hypothetical protein GCM10010293_62440 [Streptomyces griseoflavus]|uniref:helix-turn-helix domain-containing protein n=1 Tax=Streptomyces griseoflavus TaxID=35619 RepID=UPI00167EEA4D|nr:helix-turn-helix transcriptional regulator [Streptomyces griseoflavus]GGV50973.1 hypothetical protein GCM10010293_62440 [Streptomyces griseoflavus]
MNPEQSFAAWLTQQISQRGYDLNQRGEQTRFARAAGLKAATLSRLLRGGADPDIKTCGDLARALGCKTTHVLAAAGLIPGVEEPMPTPRPLTRRDHLVGLVGNDPAAQEAVIVLLRALRKWPESS